MPQPLSKLIIIMNLKLLVVFSEINCPLLGTVANAIQAGNGTRVDTIISVTCSEGLRFLDGNFEKIVQCKGNEEWNETLTDCDGQYY